MQGMAVCASCVGRARAGHKVWVISSYDHGAEMLLSLPMLFAKGDQSQFGPCRMQRTGRLVKILVDAWKQRTQGRAS